MVKNLAAMQETQGTQVQSLGWEDPLQEEMATGSSFLAWEIPGQRSLEGCSPWGCEESDRTEHTQMDVSQSAQDLHALASSKSSGQLPYSPKKAGETISRLMAPSSLDGEGNGTPLQYSCLENPIDGGAWWATVHGIAKSRTRLNGFTHSIQY